jgi:hypothetical protein
VPSYRLYFLNHGGHIVRAKELACTSDEEAVTEAKRWVDGETVELWERARLLARFDPNR